MAPLVYQTAGVPKTSSDNETWPKTQQSKARQEKENPEREKNGERQTTAKQNTEEKRDPQHNINIYINYQTAVHIINIVRYKLNIHA